MRVFLSGAMGYKWRERATRWFGIRDIKALDPTKYYNVGEDYSEESKKKEIMRFELNCVRNSDVLLVNCEKLGKSIGSTIEIYEAYKNHIPVVAFCNGDISQERIHSWVLECIDKIFIGSDALYDAIDYIKNYYGTYL